MYLSAQRDGDNLQVELTGNWRGADLSAIESELEANPLAGVQRLCVTVPESHELDLAGAWALHHWLQAAEKAGATVEFVGPKPKQIELIDATLAGKARITPPSSSESTFEPVTRLGKVVTRRVSDFKFALDFIGLATLTFFRASTSWRRLRPISIARHIYETGITAIPIVSLIAFLITLIIACIAAQQAREYGA